MSMRSIHLSCALALGVAFALGAGGVSAAQQTKAPTWITTKGKTVHLTLIAAYKNVMAGYNFNGYGQGRMTITVPKGDTVNVTFSNATSLPHSAEITTYTKTLPTGGVAAAFKGADSPNPADGVTKGVTQTFSFVASKAGKYLLICAVPGHAAAGMWDNFVVSSSAKSGSIKTGK